MHTETLDIPAPIRWTIAALSAALLVSGVAGVVVGQVVPPKPAWPLMGFEGVIAFSSVFGLLLVAGRVRQAPALTVLCVAGAAAVGTVLGYLAVKSSLAHLPLKPWLAARLGAAMVLTACAVFIALGSNRTAWKTLWRAGMFAAPLVGVLLWYRLARFAPLDAPLPGFRDALRLGAIVVIALACAVCLCAVVHLSIRAFAIADEAGRRS